MMKDDDGCLEYQRVADNACFSKSYSTDAGYDLGSSEDIVLGPGETMLIPTGIQVTIPTGYFGLLVGRSSLQTKLNCVLITGVIDAGYRGEVLMNVSNLDDCFQRKIKKGSRIAQLIVMPIYTGEVILNVTKLSTTERGEGGFGSTD